MAIGFGPRFRKFRQDRDISVRRLANAIGCNHSTLSLLESGKRVASRKLVEKLATHFKGDPEFRALLADELPEEHDRLFPGRSPASVRSPSSIASVSLDVLFCDVETQTSPEKTLFYRLLLDHLKAHAPDERTRVYVDAYEIAFFYFRSPAEQERDRLFAECHRLLNTRVAQRDPNLASRLHQKIARYYHYKGDYPSALEHYEAARRLAAAAQQHRFLGRILREMSETQESVGDYEAAVDLINSAIESAISLDEKARSRQRLAIMRRTAGNLVEAEHDFMESLELWRRFFRGSDVLPHELAVVLAQIGDLYLDWYRFQDSIEWLKQAKVVIQRILRASTGNVYALYQLALVECATARAQFGIGKVTAARKALEDIIERYGILQHSYRDFVFLIAYRELGKVFLSQGRFDQAIQAFEDALNHIAASPHPIAQWETEILLAECKLQQGDLAFADDVVRKLSALLVTDHPRQRYVFAQLSCLQGRLHFADGQWEDGIRAYHKACRAALQWNPILLWHPVRDRLEQQTRDLAGSDQEDQAVRLLAALADDSDLPEFVAELQKTLLNATERER